MAFSRTFWLLPAVVIPLPFLFIVELAPGSTLWLQRIWDAGHVPLFASWMVVAIRLLPLPHTVFFITVRAAVLLAAAVAIELIQMHTGREFSMLDIYLDACGIAVGARLALPVTRRLPSLQRRLVDIVLVVCIGIGLKDAGLFLFDRIYMSAQFPQLWSATQPLPELRFSGSATRKIVAGPDTGKPLLSVNYGTEEFSSFELVAMTGDWRGYTSLDIDVLNPAATALDIVCRVHDEPHYGNGARLSDRFNRRLTLVPGWNTLSISLREIEVAPASRRMQMDHIANLNCFTIRLAAPAQVYFREIRLVP